MSRILVLLLASALSGCSLSTESGLASAGQLAAPVMFVSRHFALGTSLDALRLTAERSFAPLGFIVRPRGRLMVIRPSDDRGVVVVVFADGATLTAHGRLYPNARPNGSTSLANILAAIEALPGVGGRGAAVAPPVRTPSAPSAPAAPAADGLLRPLRPRPHH